MLKRGKEKTYRLYKKDKKSFSKAPCEALNIKHCIGQNSQLHRFTDSQIHSFTAEGFLRPNKFTIKHKQIYSHKKTQRPQRAQRIIKDAITKTTLNIFAKLSFAQRFACSAVKFKNIRSCLI